MREQAREKKASQRTPSAKGAKGASKGKTPQNGGFSWEKSLKE